MQCLKCGYDNRPDAQICRRCREPLLSTEELSLIQPPASNNRLGCYFCFETLDPKDKRTGHGIFAKCSQCDAVYHAICWYQHKECFRCDNSQVRPIEISPPPPLEVVTKVDALPIEASVIAYSFDRYGIAVPDSIYRHVLPAIEGYETLVLAALISIILLSGCLCSCTFMLFLFT